jgi:hypothetical protein
VLFAWKSAGARKPGASARRASMTGELVALQLVTVMATFPLTGT